MPNKDGKQRKPKWDPNKNHGRYSAADYWGCPVISITHENLSVGDWCPDCLIYNTQSKLQADDPGVLVRLKGNPLITGMRYCYEKLFCVTCNAQYSARLPADIVESQKYDVTCYTAIAIGRYYIGLPFKRIESTQSAQGVPLADATQWDKMDALCDIAIPIYKTLETFAANGDTIFYDDTPNRILAHQQSYKNKETSRKGVYTTAVVSQIYGKEICLFYTSERYAGENMNDLLLLRSNSSPLITMSDASPNNKPKKMDDDMLARWIMCFCLVHGRRKFFEICNFFDEDCEFVLNIIGKVYQHEVTCVEGNYTAEKRLQYHQQHSAVLMESLRVWLNNKLLYLDVEANSGLGDAIQYMLKYWKALTRFLHVAGAPIDNSLCERTIKVAIRHRRNSLFFKTSRGAAVGDCLMSIIHTAIRNGINPYDYLNQLQYHADDVKAHPGQWLPWTYQETLQILLKAA